MIRLILILMLCIFTEGSFIPMMTSKRTYVDSPSSLDPVPMPLFLKKSGAIYCLSHGFGFNITGQDCSLLRNYIIHIYRYLSNPISSTINSQCTMISLATIAVDKPCNDSTLNKFYPSEDMDESYSLNITSKGGTLYASEVWGAMRGLETFAQLLFRTTSGQIGIPNAIIIDKPRFAHRGLMLDTSRHYLRKSSILENLELMAMNKMNVFHWHIVDDQSFPYDSVNFPQLSKQGAYNPYTRIYTQEDIADVIEHGRRLGIRVMPEFDTPGHTASWGKGQPGFLTPCYSGAKVNGQFGPVDPSREANFEFLETFFGEIRRVFPEKYVHLGGDEVSFDCWKSNPGINAFMKAHNIKTYADLEAYYIRRVVGIAGTVESKRKDGTSVVWQDVFDNKGVYNRTLVVHIWKNNPSWENEIASVTKSGYRAILSSCWYLNYISYGSDYKNYYSCDPQQFNGPSVQQKLVLGGEACMWGEYVDDSNVISRTWPRASAVAEALWTMSFRKNYGSFQKRLSTLLCRMRKRGFSAEPINGPSSCAVPSSP